MVINQEQVLNLLQNGVESTILNGCICKRVPNYHDFKLPFQIGQTYTFGAIRLNNILQLKVYETYKEDPQKFFIFSPYCFNTFFSTL